MGLRSCTNSIALLLFRSYFCFVFCAAIDTITPTQSIRDPGFIISNGSVFKLGFFSPSGSTNRYVGIWYNEISVPTVIWVANRDKPLTDSSGIVTISEEGNLLVMNGHTEILWSSNISNTATNASAHLFDTGNLVLQEVNSNNGDNDGRMIWESFPHPSDSLLPKMRLTLYLSTGESQRLTSWRSPSDPSTGSFSVGVDPLKLPEIFIWNGSRIHWRSGPWNNQIFMGVPTMDPVYLYGFQLVEDKDQETIYVTLASTNESLLSNFVLDSEGKLVQRYWDDEKEGWENRWIAPATDCDFYSKCGAFGSCNQRKSPICSCLKGFVPKNKEEWSSGNWTSGCMRRTQLQCEIKSIGGEGGTEDGFSRLKNMKVPDFSESLKVRRDDCKSLCLNNCSCLAYAFDLGIGCLLWSGDLIDVQKMPSGGTELYLRLAHSELDSPEDFKTKVTIAVVAGVIITAICTYFAYVWMDRGRGSMPVN